MNLHTIFCVSIHLQKNIHASNFQYTSQYIHLINAFDIFLDRKNHLACMKSVYLY